MRILITRTDRIGDVTLSTPAIKAVRDKYPGAHIAVCVRLETRGILEGNPYLDEVIVYDKFGAHRGVKGKCRFISILRKNNFDMALILHPTSHINLSCFLAMIPERIGYDKKMGYLLTRKVPHTKEKGEKHELEYTLDILRCAGKSYFLRYGKAQVKLLTKPSSKVMETVLGGIFFFSFIRVTSSSRETTLYLFFHRNSICLSKPLGHKLNLVLSSLSSIE